MTVLEIRNLSVSYASRRGVAQAVRDLSLSIEPGETYGLVGESGCGKSTVALSIMRYLPRQAKTQGSILYQGQDLMTVAADELRRLRGNRIAMVYQDPQASLNPVLNIGAQLTEVLLAHEHIARQEARERVIAMLERVRLPDPGAILERYPHQLSGGMQQRGGIAMALLLRPGFGVLDEPATGGDGAGRASGLGLRDGPRGGV